MPEKFIGDPARLLVESRHNPQDSFKNAADLAGQAGNMADQISGGGDRQEARPLQPPVPKRVQEVGFFANRPDIVNSIRNVWGRRVNDKTPNPDEEILNLVRNTVDALVDQRAVISVNPSEMTYVGLIKELGVPNIHSQAVINAFVTRLAHYMADGVHIDDPVQNPDRLTSQDLAWLQANADFFASRGIREQGEPNPQDLYRSYFQGRARVVPNKLERAGGAGVFEGRNGKNLEIGRLLSDEGVYGRVYLAKYPGGDKDVVIKVGRSRDEALRKRFEGEAQILRSFQENGVAHVPNLHNASNLRGVPYMVMDLAEGERLDSLARRTQESRERVQASTQIAEQMVETFSAAIKLGVAYDDVKLGSFFWDQANQNLTIIDWNGAEQPTQQAQQNNIKQTIDTLFNCSTGIKPTSLFSHGRVNSRMVDQIAGLPPELRKIILKGYTRGLAKDYPQYQSLDELLVDIRIARQEASRFAPGKLWEVADSKEIFSVLPEKIPVEYSQDQLIDFDPSARWVNVRTRWGLGSGGIEGGIIDEGVKIFRDLEKLVKEKRIPIPDTSDRTILDRGLENEVIVGPITEAVRARIYEPFEFLVNLAENRDSIPFAEVRRVVGSIKSFTEYGADTPEEDVQRIRQLFQDHSQALNQLGIEVPQVLRQLLPGQPTERLEIPSLLFEHPQTEQLVFTIAKALKRNPDWTEVRRVFAEVESPEDLAPSVSRRFYEPLRFMLAISEQVSFTNPERQALGAFMLYGPAMDEAMVQGVKVDSKNLRSFFEKNSSQIAALGIKIPQVLEQFLPGHTESFAIPPVPGIDAISTAELNAEAGIEAANRDTSASSTEALRELRRGSVAFARRVVEEKMLPGDLPPDIKIFTERSLDSRSDRTIVISLIAAINPALQEAERSGKVSSELRMSWLEWMGEQEEKIDKHEPGHRQENDERVRRLIGIAKGEQVEVRITENGFEILMPEKSSVLNDRMIINSLAMAAQLEGNVSPARRQELVLERVKWFLGSEENLDNSVLAELGEIMVITNLAGSLYPTSRMTEILTQLGMDDRRGEILDLVYRSWTGALQRFRDGEGELDLTLEQVNQALRSDEGYMRYLQREEDGRMGIPIEIQAAFENGRLNTENIDRLMGFFDGVNQASEVIRALSSDEREDLGYDIVGSIRDTIEANPWRARSMANLIPLLFPDWISRNPGEGDPEYAILRAFRTVGRLDVEFGAPETGTQAYESIVSGFENGQLSLGGIGEGSPKLMEFFGGVAEVGETISRLPDERIDEIEERVINEMRDSITSDKERARFFGNLAIFLGLDLSTTDERRAAFYKVRNLQ